MTQPDTNIFLLAPIPSCSLTLLVQDDEGLVRPLRADLALELYHLANAVVDELALGVDLFIFFIKKNLISTGKRVCSRCGFFLSPASPSRRRSCRRSQS